VGRHLSGLIIIIIAVIATTIVIDIAIVNDIVARMALRREVGAGLIFLIVKSIIMIRLYESRRPTCNGWQQSAKNDVWRFSSQPNDIYRA
jgi:hypothetical protein